MEVDAVVAGHRPDAPDAALFGAGCAGAAEAALAAVASAIDALTVVDLTVPATGAVLDLLRGVETQCRRLYGVSVAVIGQIDSRGLAAPAGQSSTVSLVRQVITAGRTDAAARVRLAAAVCPTVGLSGAAVPAQLPLLAAAVSAGTIGARHADLVTWVFKTFKSSVGGQLRDSVEQFLLEQAVGLDPVTFENVCRKIVLMADPDGPQEEKDAHDRQEFHIGSRRPNGLTKVWGLLDDLTVEALRAAFGAMGAPAAQRSKYAPPEDPTPPTPGTPPTPEPMPENSGHQDAAPDDTESEDPAPEVAESEQLPTQDETPEHPITQRTPTTTDHLDPDDPSEPAHIQAADTDPPAHAPAGTDPPPTYHPQRLPYDWAPLGTVPGDYPHRPPGTAEPPAGTTDPPGEPPLTPRLFGDTPCPQPAEILGPDGTPRQQDPAGTPPAATRRAQALGVMITHFLGHGAAPTQGGEKPHLLVTVDERSLRDRLGHGTLGYGTHISIQQVRMLACDSSVIAAVLGGRSQPLDMGRSMRAFNAATARAILLRDKGCTFPGCDMPGQWTENHHIRPWAEGGPSDYSNGCLLCRRHHTLIHHTDWQIRIAPDGTPELIPPATYDPTRTPQRNTLHHPPTFPWPQKI